MYIANFSTTSTTAICIKRHTYKLSKTVPQVKIIHWFVPQLQMWKMEYKDLQYIMSQLSLIKIRKKLTNCSIIHTKYKAASAMANILHSTQRSQQYALHWTTHSIILTIKLKLCNR